MTTENKAADEDVFNKAKKEELEVIKNLREINGASQNDIEQNLVGLAFSGGGIRSATFGLGVLQALKENDLLKKIDYLSTVSGGGYIGAWLSANCHRQGNRWLDKDEKKEEWNKSIWHLRRYSNYLSPNISFLSADTWSMATIWLRNTLLIQTMIVMAIAVLLLLPRVFSPIMGIEWDKSQDISPIVEFEWAYVLYAATFLLFAYLVIKIASNLVYLKSDNQDEHHNFFSRWIKKVKKIENDNLKFSKEQIKPIIEDKNFNSVAKSELIFNRLREYRLKSVIETDEAALKVKIQRIIEDDNINLTGKIKRIEDIYFKLTEKLLRKSDQSAIQRLVIASMLVSLGISTMLWVQLQADTTEISSFWMCIKFISGNDWQFLLFAYMTFVLFSICSSHSNYDKPENWSQHFVVTALPASIVLYLLLATILYILVTLNWVHFADKGGSLLVFSWLPPLILGAFSLAIVVLIGMQGKDSYESVREWWARFGAWLAICGFVWMVIVIIAFYSPLWSAVLYYDEPWKALSLGTGWIGTTIAGLFAGKSPTTGGKNDKTGAAKIKEIIAKITPFIFIAGLLIIVAMIVHLTIAVNSNENFTISQAELLGKSTQTDNQLTLNIDAKTDVQLDVRVKQPHVAASPIQKAPQYSKHWELLAKAEHKYYVILLIFMLCAFCLWVLNCRVDINVFSLSAFYRNRLTRCYLGATRFGENERHPHEFTGFDDDDDLKMDKLLDEKKIPLGPLHIVNCALNLGGSDDLTLHTRHSANFTMTPLYCGSYYEVKKPDGNPEYPIGYRPTKSYGGENHAPTLGQAISLSGAAASPNMGYHTSAPVAFLMTLFNVRLGGWLPNPNPKNKPYCNQPSPEHSLVYLLRELFGLANEKSEFLAISDGGHFENLAAYELVKRKCKVIIISDGECDPDFEFEGLGTLIRMCKVDNLATINIEVRPIHRRDELGRSGLCYSVGTIEYKDSPSGILIYIKASMDGDEDTAVMQYKASHPDFPHETTSDQFYGEDQFESYRSLGHHIATQMFNQYYAETQRTHQDERKIENVVTFADELKHIIAKKMTELVDIENNITEATHKLKSLLTMQN